MRLRPRVRHFRLALVIALPVLVWWHWPAPDPGFDRADNGLWMSRHALHGTSAVSPEALVPRLKARGITRIYPFLGPPDVAGVPGWRSGRTHHRYPPDVARRFVARMRALAPEIAVLPWTGGVWNEQIFLDDPRQRDRLFEHLRGLVDAGAAGVHLNVEPLPDGDPAFLRWLVRLRTAIPTGEISIATFPPPWLLRDVSPVNWSLDTYARLCGVADELVVMGYDTGLPVGRLYEALMAKWTAALADRLGGLRCRWRMGVPTYEDDEAWHDPRAETLRRALRGVRRGLPAPPPIEFRGVALYAAWTTDAREWDTLSTEWNRGASPSLAGPRLTP